jgi:hypothetical protein
MNELLADTKTVLLWLFGAIGSLLGVLGLIAMSILKGYAKRISTLEAEAVRRVEFNQLREDFQSKHDENGGKLDEIKKLIERNHTDATDGRHRVGNQILSLSEKVGRVEGRLGLDEFSRRGG